MDIQVRYINKDKTKVGEWCKSVADNEALQRIFRAPNPPGRVILEFTDSSAAEYRIKPVEPTRAKIHDFWFDSGLSDEEKLKFIFDWLELED